VWPQYVSHKIGRLVVPWALMGLLVASIALARESWVYTTALVLQLGFYGLAIAGALTAVTTGMRRVPRVAHTFVVMNYSAIAGLFALRHGRQVWK
jgi:hypothetical protein